MTQIPLKFSIMHADRASFDIREVRRVCQNILHIFVVLVDDADLDSREVRRGSQIVLNSFVVHADGAHLDSHEASSTQTYCISAQ